jgi:hypothetical protein
MNNSNVLTFPSQPPASEPRTIFRQITCPECRRDRMASLQRYPRNRAVAWRCLTCDALIRDRKGRIFVPHHELRACGIDPDNLPPVRP